MSCLRLNSSFPPAFFPASVNVILYKIIHFQTLLHNGLKSVSDRTKLKWAGVRNQQFLVQTQVMIISESNTQIFVVINQATLSYHGMLMCFSRRLGGPDAEYFGLFANENMEDSSLNSGISD